MSVPSLNLLKEHPLITSLFIAITKPFFGFKDQTEIYKTTLGIDLIHNVPKIVVATLCKLLLIYVSFCDLSYLKVMELFNLPDNV